MYQATLLDPATEIPLPITPQNKTHFRLAELYKHLDCETVEVVTLSDTLILLVDEEGKFNTENTVNLLATYIWHSHVPEMRGVDCIVGKAILCHTDQFR